MQIHSGSITTGNQAGLFDIWSPANQQMIAGRQSEPFAQLRRQAQASRLSAKPNYPESGYTGPFAVAVQNAHDVALGNITQHSPSTKTQSTLTHFLLELREGYCFNLTFSGLVATAAASPWLGLFLLFKAMT